MSESEPYEPNVEVLERIQKAAEEAEQGRRSDAKRMSRAGTLLSGFAALGSAIAGGGVAFAEDLTQPWPLVFAIIAFAGSGMAGAAAVVRAPERAAVAQRDAAQLAAHQRWAAMRDLYIPGMSLQQRRALVLEFAKWLDSIEGVEVPSSILDKVSTEDRAPGG